MSRSGKRAANNGTTSGLPAQFVQALVSLRDRADTVVWLGRQGIRRGIAELDDSGDLQRRMLFLMNDIEGSFRTIRQKMRG